MALTGRIDFRKNLFGSVILLVEEDAKAALSRKTKRRWRRATLMDLAQPELRILIDMRAHPHFSARTPQRPAATGTVVPALPREARIDEGKFARTAH
jgi:hypothetical protein